MWGIAAVSAVLLASSGRPGRVAVAAGLLLFAYALVHVASTSTAFVPFVVLVVSAGAWAWLTARWPKASKRVA